MKDAEPIVGGQQVRKVIENPHLRSGTPGERIYSNIDVRVDADFWHRDKRVLHHRLPTNGGLPSATYFSGHYFFDFAQMPALGGSKSE